MTYVSINGLHLRDRNHFLNLRDRNHILIASLLLLLRRLLLRVLELWSLLVTVVHLSMLGGNDPVHLLPRELLDVLLL